MIAWLRRLAALMECAVGDHVPPRKGVVHHYRFDEWLCARCGAHVTVHRGPS